jgi:cytochrome c oxidase subunit 3
MSPDLMTGALSAHPRAADREEQVRLGLWMFLATVTMLFAAFTSAYIVRRGGADWAPVALPPILWLNTAVLGASSLTLEAAGRLGAARRWRRAIGACAAALALGVAFLAGQVAAWRHMAADGVYVSSNPHSSFFYVLTGAHALHVAAALGVLAWGLAATWSGSRDPRVWTARMEICRTFWHYLGAVWVFLFALVSVY